MSRRVWLWIAVVLLLLYWAARTWALTAFPPFIDESVHVEFGRTILASGPFARAEEGRQLTLWLYILFGAQRAAPLWTIRMATLLATTLSAAALIGSVKLLTNYWGALCAGVLLIFSPYHQFFERLALADPVSAAAVMLAAYFAARLAQRTGWRDAALCGIALFLAVGAKLTAIPYLAIPVLAAFTLRRTRSGVQWAAAALAAAIGLCVLFFGLAIWRGHSPFTLLGNASSTSSGSVIDAIIDGFLPNAARTARTVIGYFGVPAALLMLVSMIYLALRRRFFALLCLLIPLGALWLSARQESRFLVASMSLLILTVGVALGVLVDQRRAWRLPVVAVISAWGLGLWLPFALTAARDPVHLALPADDYTQYVAADGSGFGLSDVIAVLQPQNPTRVIGVLANCLSLRDLAPFPVDCPRLNPNGEDVPELDNLLATSRESGVYVVLETIPYAPSTAPGSVIATVDSSASDSTDSSDTRHRPRLTIYDLAP